MPTTEITIGTEIGVIRAAGYASIGSPGARPSMQDRSEIKRLSTQSGLDLLVAIVADGVGGGVEGDTVAEVTITKVLEYLQKAQTPDVCAAIKEAVESAHQDILDLKKSKAIADSTTFGSTIAMTVIYQNKLYVANVGDSRIYLIRNGKLYQLTEDQTWGNAMVKSHRLTLEEVKGLSVAGRIIQYIGLEREILVDQVVYGPDGMKDFLELLPEDGLLLCTDGLIKERISREEPFVSDEEILDTFAKELPRAAANRLVAFALGRKVDDNVSVIAIQVSGKGHSLMLARKRYNSKVGRAALMGSIAGILFLVLMILLTPYFSPLIPAFQPSITPAQVTTAAPQTAQAMVLAAKGSQYARPGYDTMNLKTGDELPAGAGSRMWTTLAGSAELQLADGSKIFVDGQTQVYLTVLPDPENKTSKTILRLERGAVFLIGKNADFRIETSDKDWFATNRGSRIGAIYDGKGRFQIDCFEGECQVGSPEKKLELLPGQGGGFEDAILGAPRPVTFEQWTKFAGIAVPTPSITPTSNNSSTPTP